MAFLMSLKQNSAVQKPQFLGDINRSKPNVNLLPRPFAEPFNALLAPPTTNPSGLLPWFHSEKPVFRQRTEQSSVKTVTSSQKPWMTAEILYEIRKKHSLLQKAKNEDTIVAWNEFKQQRSMVSQMLRDAKLKHEIKSFSHQKDKKFYCDSCDRGFAHEAELNAHLAEHVYCSVDGCSFKAHPKIIAVHKRMQHDTGLAGRVMSFDTPEDIRKWREERRRNFPTATNIERKKNEEEERRARGEILKTKYFGKMKGSASNQHQQVDEFVMQMRGKGHRGRGRRRRRNRTFRGCSRGNTNNGTEHSRQSVVPQVPLFSEENLEEDTNGNLKRFRGTESSYETEELIAQTVVNLESHGVLSSERKRRRSNKRGRGHFANSELKLQNLVLVEESLEHGPTNKRVRENEELNENVKSSEVENEEISSVKDTSRLCKVPALELRNVDLNRDSGICVKADVASISSRDKSQTLAWKSIPNNCHVKVLMLDSGNNHPDWRGSISSDVKADSSKESSSDLVPNVEELEEGEIVDSEEELDNSHFVRGKADNATSSCKEGALASASVNIPSFFSVNDDEESDEVTETTEKPVVHQEAAPTKVGGALGSLIECYGADSESDGEVKDDNHQAVEVTDAEPSSSKPTNRKPVPDMYPISRRRITLLEKLLQNEIRKERNVILQCVHYIVKNNFFIVDK